MNLIGQKRCKIECSDVSETTWKKSLLKPWENDYSLHLAVFLPDPPKNLALPTTSKFLVWKNAGLEKYSYQYTKF